MAESERHTDIGTPVESWQGALHPAPVPMAGEHCRLEPLQPAHAEGLFEAYRADREGLVWDYLPYGPFSSLDEFTSFLSGSCLGADPLFYTIIDRLSGRPAGMASYLRIDPANGVIEVGHINFSPTLQRRPAATEAMYLMMRQVFVDWGYRRYEWKCNNLNERSKAAAGRLGFSFEGVFRQAAVIKGHNRDTAWFSILDSEWPACDAAFRAWLDPANFDDDGVQLADLAALRNGPTVNRP